MKYIAVVQTGKGDQQTEGEIRVIGRTFAEAAIQLENALCGVGIILEMREAE